MTRGWRQGSGEMIEIAIVVEHRDILPETATEIALKEGSYREATIMEGMNQDIKDPSGTHLGQHTKDDSNTHKEDYTFNKEPTDPEMCHRTDRGHNTRYALRNRHDKDISHQHNNTKVRIGAKTETHARIWDKHVRFKE